jgi:hypothetical protein
MSGIRALGLSTVAAGCVVLGTVNCSNPGNIIQLHDAGLPGTGDNAYGGSSSSSSGGGSSGGVTSSSSSGSGAGDDGAVAEASGDDGGPGEGSGDDASLGPDASGAGSADGGVLDATPTDFDVTPPVDAPPSTVDAQACQNLGCIDFLDCLIFHGPQVAPCGFTTCQNLVCH